MASLTNNEEQDVRTWLNSQGLGKYADSLIDGGADTMEVLFNEVNDDALSELSPPIPKLKRGQILRKIAAAKTSGATKTTSSTKSTTSKFTPIIDSYFTLDAVQKDLRKHGLEGSDMILGLDFTGSNSWQGRRTFNDGKNNDDWSENLHRLDPTGSILNPYQQVITAIGAALSVFDDDNLIPAFGFGDKETSHDSIFDLNSGQKCGAEFGVAAEPCEGFDTVLAKYSARVKDRILWGKTTFHPLINEAARIAREEESFHILVIVGDGAIEPESNVTQTIEAIVNASKDAPLSIIMVGVGDGPWDLMEQFDDELPARVFDNFQFVDFDKAFKGNSQEEKEAHFAMSCLQEIPEQYLFLKNSANHGLG